MYVCLDMHERAFASVYIVSRTVHRKDKQGIKARQTVSRQMNSRQRKPYTRRIKIEIKKERREIKKEGGVKER